MVVVGDGVEVEVEATVTGNPNLATYSGSYSFSSVSGSCTTRFFPRTGITQVQLLRGDGLTVGEDLVASDPEGVVVEEAEEAVGTTLLLRRRRTQEDLSQVRPRTKDGDPDSGRAWRVEPLPVTQQPVEVTGEKNRVAIIGELVHLAHLAHLVHHLTAGQIQAQRPLLDMRVLALGPPAEDKPGSGALTICHIE